MGIVTKGGDKGKTSLYRGGRVSKDHIRMETIGSLDEVSSYLGVSKSILKSKKKKKIIESIQKDIFLINAEIATASGALKKRIGNSQVSRLEDEIIELEAKLAPKLKGFSLSGKTKTSSNIDLARTITRRVERRAVTLQRKKILKNEDILVYLNRLSDLLYLLARSCDK
jgi:cob(I)alamin adenosyltransferase